jgi:transcriptional regulator with XRE-family HTH domain
MAPKDQSIVTLFASALKQLRQESGLNQSKLSDIANIERKHIHRLEKGEVDPTIATVYKLADAIGIGVITIIERMEDRNEAKL